MLLLTIVFSGKLVNLFYLCRLCEFLLLLYKLEELQVVVFTENIIVKSNINYFPFCIGETQ